MTFYINCQNPALQNNLVFFFLLIGNVTDILQEAEVHYISRKICNSEMGYGDIIPQTSFCAGDEDGIFDTCRVRPNNFPYKYILKPERT